MMIYTEANSDILVLLRVCMFMFVFLSRVGAWYRGVRALLLLLFFFFLQSICVIIIIIIIPEYTQTM